MLSLPFQNSLRNGRSTVDSDVHGFRQLQISRRGTILGVLKRGGREDSHVSDQPPYDIPAEIPLLIVEESVFLSLMD